MVVVGLRFGCCSDCLIAALVFYLLFMLTWLFNCGVLLGGFIGTFDLICCYVVVVGDCEFRCCCLFTWWFMLLDYCGLNLRFVCLISCLCLLFVLCVFRFDEVVLFLVVVMFCLCIVRFCWFAVVVVGFMLHYCVMLLYGFVICTCCFVARLCYLRDFLFGDLASCFGLDFTACGLYVFWLLVTGGIVCCGLMCCVSSYDCELWWWLLIYLVVTVFRMVCFTQV